MDFEAWTVNSATLTATHTTGFTLQWEGSAKDPCAIHPGKFPGQLSSIEQVRLLRHGVEFIAKNAKQASSGPKVSSYVAPANKPARSLLSLKPRNTETA